MEGLAIKIFGMSGSTMDVVYDLRWVGAVLGAVTVTLGFLIMRKLVSTNLAWLCAAILIFDPFVLRNNGRVYLETPAVVFILGGYLVLMSALKNDNTRLRPRAAITAGLLLGYGIFTKDVMVMLAVVPILLATVWRQTLHRRDAILIAAATAGAYVAYLVFVAINGLLGTWIQAKESGMERILGLQQVTGFNAPNAPSLLSRIIDQAGHFGASYILLIACPIAGILAVFSSDRRRRLIGLSAISMGALGTYAALFGTFEEQYGYGVMVFGTLAIGAAIAELRERYPRRQQALNLAFIVLVVLSIGLGIRAEVTPDNGFQRVQAWFDNHLPATAHVSVTTNTGQLAFADDPRFGVWTSALQLQDHDARYVLTENLPVSEGYG